MIFFLLLQGFLVVLGFINGWWLLWLPALIWMISTLVALFGSPRAQISSQARAQGYEICPKCGKTFDTLNQEQLRSFRQHEC